MVKPVIKKITPIDVTKDNYYAITYSGAIRRIVTNIYNAATLDLVATSDVITNSSSNLLIPKGDDFTNGSKYAIQITIYDGVEGSNITSITSDKLFFWALSTPTFKFSNLEESSDPSEGKNKLTTSSFNAIVTYSQAENEPLSSYNFYWYNSGKTLLNTSDTSYDTSLISYQYKGLEADNIYYFRCTGLTKNGIQVDTGLIVVIMDYTKGGSYSQIIAKFPEEYIDEDGRECNLGNPGVVRYDTNIIDINATRDDYSYTTNPVLIDLTDDTVEYNSGYKVSGDFTVVIKFRKGSGTILELIDDGETGKVEAITDDQGYKRYKLTVSNAISQYTPWGNYIIYSDPMNITDDDLVVMYVQKLNGLYGLTVNKV